MTYDELLAQVVELLQRDKRVAYRVLKRRFGLDDEYVDDLKADLIKAKRLALDEDGEVLVWVGDRSPEPEGQRTNFPRSAPSLRLRDSSPDYSRSEESKMAKLNKLTISLYFRMTTGEARLRSGFRTLRFADCGKKHAKTLSPKGFLHCSLRTHE